MDEVHFEGFIFKPGNNKVVADSEIARGPDDARLHDKFGLQLAGMAMFWNLTNFFIQLAGCSARAAPRPDNWG